MAPEPQKNNSTLITIAIIGIVGTIIAATIGALGNYNTEKLRQEAELTRIALVSSPARGESPTSLPPTSVLVAQLPPTPTLTKIETDIPPTQNIVQSSQTIALSDKFDGSVGSYDTNLWDCASECSIQNLFLRDGVLNLQRSNKGTTYVTSRSQWAYSALASLTGKFQINSNSNHGEWGGWLSLSNNGQNIIGCGFFGTETPYVQCNFGHPLEYETNKLPIKFDTWYTITFDFDQNSHDIRFYLGNTLIGDYVPPTKPDTAHIDVGIWSQDATSTNQIYIDDVLLALNK